MHVIQACFATWIILYKSKQINVLLIFKELLKYWSTIQGLKKF